ncbi:MAG: glutamate--cysteine ligase [Bdellovibrionales bacterium]|nr:glutamate--cysteine ligase [Bdellovibrionales bacterium]
MGIQRPGPFFAALNERLPEVTSLLARETSSCGYPVYSSLDIRDAGWKVAAVDVNLFPAGFNNLTTEDRARAAKFMREFLSAKLMITGPWRIAVVPEAHTSNMGYLENLGGILGILRDAGCEPRLLWPGEPIPKPWKIKTPSGVELEYLPAAQALDGAQALLLNHDLSGGIPKVIQNVQLPTFPSSRLGWYRRRKSNHQQIVDALLEKLARQLDFFDPWYFAPKSILLPSVDFSSDAGLDAVATEATRMMEGLRREYDARGIEDSPRIFIKNDAGTYGLGVVSVKDPADIRDGGRWLRNKMRKGKDSVAVSQVILQEAIPTALHYQKVPGDPASTVAGEPVLYLVNGLPVGGFCRIHESQGADARWENLNQPGSILEPLACDKAPGSARPFPKPRNSSPCEQIGTGQIYSFVARLHATAAGLEDCP